MDKMQLKALAKINLGLDVLRRREDGYHEVRMIMQTVRIFDRLQLMKQERPGIRVRTNLYYLPANENNLVYKAAKLLFEEFGLAGTEKLWPSQLSGGMRQRAALLRTYLFSQNVALLDEPFSALDTLTKSAVHEWYLKVMDEIRLSTLFITHDIDEAILLSDRIYLLVDGRIGEEIVVDQPRPRHVDFSLTQQFLAYKRRIMAALHAQG